MPVLQTKTDTKAITLKHSGAKVTVSTRMVPADVMSAAEATNDVTSVLLMLENIIHDWDFTDENGEKLPIAFDVLKYLSLEDFTQLSLYVTEVTEKSEKARKLPADEVKS